MTKLIASVVVLVAFAVLVLMNAGYRSTVNLFGARFENISVIVIAVAGFILGVAYSLVLYVLNFFKKRSKQQHVKRAEALKQKEIELARREDSATRAASQSRPDGAAASIEPPQAAATPGGTAAPAGSKAESAGLIRKLLRRKRPSGNP